MARSRRLTRKTISLNEIAARMVDPKIAIKMITGYFQQLSRPSPSVASNILTISCVDSRLPPASLLNHDYGQAYAIQTVANVVPQLNLTQPLDDQSFEVAAGIEYAVMHKMVSEIFLIGHTHCGGAEARVFHPESLPKVNHWMSHVEMNGLHSAPTDEMLKMISDPNNQFMRDALLRHSERGCVESSMRSIRALPFVKEAIANTRLSLAGLICNMDAGELKINFSDSASLDAVNDLVTGFRTFQKDEWGPHGRMHDLVTHGQHPQALIITGMSPHVAPENVFGIEPGDAFIHRRIGGHYHHERTPGGLAATIEFAVKAKEVKTVIIVGHQHDVNDDYMRGLMDPHPLVTAFIEKSTPHIRQWRQAGMDPEQAHRKGLISTYFNALEHQDISNAVGHGRLSVLPISVNHRDNTLQYYDAHSNDFYTIEPPILMAA